MPEGDRILVQINSLGQPIGHARSVLTRWMTELMKQPNLCPPDAENFKEVRDNYGAELLRNVRDIKV